MALFSWFKARRATQKAQIFIEKYPQFKERLEKMIKDIEDNADDPTIAIEFFKNWLHDLEHWEWQKKRVKEMVKEFCDTRKEAAYLLESIEEFPKMIRESASYRDEIKRQLM